MTYGSEKAYKCATPGCNTFVKPPFTKCGTCNGLSMESIGKTLDRLLSQGFGSALEEENKNDNRRDDNNPL
jgi:hypothetical protein